MTTGPKEQHAPAPTVYARRLAGLLPAQGALLPPGAHRTGPGARRLITELRTTFDQLQDVAATLRTAMAVLGDDGPVEPAESVVLEAALQTWLGWLRLDHHIELLESAPLSPRDRRFVAMAKAVAPSPRATAELAAEAVRARDQVLGCLEALVAD